MQVLLYHSQFMYRAYIFPVLRYRFYPKASPKVSPNGNTMPMKTTITKQIIRQQCCFPQQLSELTITSWVPVETGVMGSAGCLM